VVGAVLAGELQVPESSHSAWPIVVGQMTPKTPTPTVAEAVPIAGIGILIGIGLVPTTVIAANEGGGGGGLVACTTISSIASSASPVGSVPLSGSLPV
jgi:hypothetical protein